MGQPQDYKLSFLSCMKASNLAEHPAHIGRLCFLHLQPWPYRAHTIWDKPLKHELRFVRFASTEQTKMLNWPLDLSSKATKLLWLNGFDP